MEERGETLGHVVWDVLHRLVRERLARKPGGHLIEGSLDRLELRLPLALRGGGADADAFARQLVRAVDQLLDDAIQHAAAFRPGHAWCHRCQGAVCEHSVPPSCRHVFVGYAQTGMPRWEDFAQLCLDRKHHEVDRLYGERPAFVTLVHEKDELHGGMLDAFRVGSYELLGQVTAGFFRVRARAEEGRGVLALTAQVAASRSGRGALRLGLNLLGRTPAGEPLDLLWERQSELPWRGAVRWAQSALQAVAASRGAARRRSRGRSSEAVEQRVAGILRGLARRLERDHRARSRRTQHAERRHESGQRPTRKALDDARGARDEALLVDERSGALVVLGDRGRTHFFTFGGQLVSSVRYGRDAIERKRKLQLWRAATGEEAEAFRASLAREERPGAEAG